MKQIILNNNNAYLVVLEYFYQNKKYLYLININDDRDVEIAEEQSNDTIIFVNNPEQLSILIKEMSSYIYKMGD